MKQVSVINIEEIIGKTVGRRQPPNHLCPKNHSIERSKGWKKAIPYGYPPKGVFLFKSHQEADEWKRKNIQVSAK